VDEAAKNVTAAALKRIALAQAHASAGEAAAALRETDRALALAQPDSIVFSAAQLYAQLGRTAQAAKLGEQLDGKLDADAQAYGALVRAEIALAQRNPRQAIDAIRTAQKLADMWPGRVLLARTYIELGALAEASSELDVVQKRRG